ncbi:rRNA maturation RNAse YbeY, partial [Weissella soli]|uniref:rRNA maturation RNAse YbeY n=1 Tax=Weissella soli TaxID=155866 RepID=UPI0035A0DB89
MDLAIFDQTTAGVAEEHIQLVHDILNYAGEYMQLADNTEMSGTIINNYAIQSFNREYRGIDKPTD